MAIRRPDPVRALGELQERMNRLFDEVRTWTSGPGDAPEDDPGTWRPPVDLVERDDRYLLRADVPGIEPEDVHVEIESETLVLRGERRRDPDVPRDAYLRSERPSGGFHVRIGLPPSVDVDGIEAVHRAGVLEVVLPKRAAVRPESIRVEVEGSGR